MSSPLRTPLFVAISLLTTLASALTATASPQDGLWIFLSPPPAGFAYAACYDLPRQRMLVFGGRSSATNSAALSGELWSCSPLAAKAWTRLEPAGTGPSARQGSAMVYDALQSRAILFGGLDASALRADVWALDINGSTTAWSTLTPSGLRPQARYQHAMAFDPIHNQVLVFGGSMANALQNDLWALDLTENAWRGLTPSGPLPAARRGATLTWDPIRERMLLCGGIGSGDFADLWELTLGPTPSWSPIVPSGVPPAARAYHAASYDPATDALVITSGLAGGILRNDTWSVSLSGVPNWTALAPAPPLPAARAFVTSVHDPALGGMLVFGGAGNGNAVLRDLWAFFTNDGSSWTRLNGAPPESRSGHTMVLDAARDRAIVHAGTTGDFGPTNDVWSIPLSDSENATKLDPAGPSAPFRQQHTAVYDPPRDRMLVFGGTDLLTVEPWALALSDPPTWTPLATAGPVPSNRSGARAVYDAARDRVLLIGGTGQIGAEVWELTLAGTPTWNRLFPTGAPASELYGFVAQLDAARDRVQVHVAQETWSLTLGGTPAWVDETPAGVTPWVNHHVGVLDLARDRMVVFGGPLVASLRLGDPVAWGPLLPAGLMPAPRNFATAIYDPLRDRMYVFGGHDNQLTRNNDLWALAWGSPLGVGDGPAAGIAPGILSTWPNPARHALTFGFRLTGRERASLRVWDVAGRVVHARDLGVLEAGAHTASWDGDAPGGHAAPGLYFASVVAGHTRVVARVTILGP